MPTLVHFDKIFFKNLNLNFEFEIQNYFSLLMDKGGHFKIWSGSILNLRKSS